MQIMGEKGGKARVSKGFASPAVMAKALETRRLRRDLKNKLFDAIISLDTT